MESIRPKKVDLDPIHVEFCNGQLRDARGPYSPTSPQRQRLFSLGKTSLNSHRASYRTYNYDDIYLEDPYGQETFSDARIWKIYLDESELFDQHRIEVWRDTIDVLLVFAGLFSAIITTFVSQTCQNLQPNYSQVTAYLVYELVNLQRAIANSTSTSTVPPSTLNPNIPFAGPSQIDVWVNGLWLTSLSLSLATTLIAVLTKQWLYHYMSSTSGSPRDRCRVRHFRHDGLRRWKVPTIIEILPLILHVALALFLVGLVLFLTTLDTSIALVVASIAGISFVLYTISFILPLIYPQSPYKSPLTRYAHFWIGYIHALPQNFRNLAWNIRHFIIPNLRGPRPTDFGGTKITDIQEEERVAVKDASSQLDVDAILWMYKSTSNSAVKNVAMQSFSGLAPPFPDMTHVRSIIIKDVWPLLQACERAEYQPLLHKERDYDRLLRTLIIGYGLTFPLHSRTSLERLSTLQPNIDDPVANLLRLIPHLSGVSNSLYSSTFSKTLSEFFPSQPKADVHLHPSLWYYLLQNYSSLPHRNSHNLKVVRDFLLCLGRGYFFADVDGISLIDIRHDANDVGSVTLHGAIESSRALRNVVAKCLFRQFGVRQEEDTQSRYELLLAIKDWALVAWTSGGSSECLLTEIPSLLLAIMKSLRYLADSLGLHHQTRIDESHAMRVYLQEFLQEATTFDDELMCWDTLYHATAACLSLPPSMIMPLAPLFTHCKRQLQVAIPSLIIEENRPTFYDCFLESVRSITEQCLDSGEESACNAIREADMLVTLAQAPLTLHSHTSNTSSLYPRLVEVTYHLVGDPSWVVEWIDYVHLPKNLPIICKTLILHAGPESAQHLLPLVCVRPMDPAWTECFQSLMSLLDDQEYLEHVRRDWGTEAPHDQLAEALKNIQRLIPGNYSRTTHQGLKYLKLELRQ